MWILLWLSNAEWSAPAGRDVLVVTSVAPLDEWRLADALQTYLRDYSVDVVVAPAIASSDLRRELGETDGAGAARRAVGAIRVVGTAGRTLEIQLVDRINRKLIVVSIPPGKMPASVQACRASMPVVRSMPA